MIKARTILKLSLLAVVVALTAQAVARAERPVAPKLLPDSTLAMVRVADTPELIAKFRETSLGRIGQDEDIKPLVSQLYASLQEAWGQIEDRVGLPLDELLKIPQGEICVAFVAPPEQQPGVVVLFDAKDRMTHVHKLLDQGEMLLIRRGGSIAQERIAEHDATAYTLRGQNRVYLIEREGTLLLATTRPLAEMVLAAWDGQAERTLADKHEFNAIMNRCRTSGDDPPQITFYADPVEAVRSLARGTAAGIGLALLPVLGLDGIKGVGGSLTFSTGDYDEVQHFHLLLDNPRAGVVEAIAMKPGDTTPERWVPQDVVSYTTLHWDVQRTFDVSAKLYNSLMYEGALEEEVQRRVSTPLGVDFQEEILPALDGRITYVQWVEKPVRINSIVNLVGIKLKDAAAFQPVFERVRQRHGDRLERQTFGSQVYWTIRVPERNVPENFRQPTPCVAIVDNYLLISDSMHALQQAIVTSTDPSRGLANSVEFKLIASRIKRQPGGNAPGMIQYTRNEEALRFWYDLATSADTQRRLGQQAENNRLFQTLDQALKDNPLPPFAAIAQYLAPGGGMMVNDETGLHYSTFTLKRK